MNFKNRVLFGLSKRIIKRNCRFKKIHKGESCYIFGNGASIKYFNLKNFNDKPSIACGALFLHKSFHELDVRYYFEGHPFYYYPYWVNPYSRRLQKNPMGSFFRKKKQSHDNIVLFCNLSNYFGIHGDNVYYAHHFDKVFKGFSKSKLDGSFTTLSSSLSGMLGLAIYMGFEDITLVGCDYSLSPQLQGHFYEFGKFPDTSNDDPHKELLLDAMKHANIRVVTPNKNYVGNLIPHIHYKELTGDKSIYKENYEILSDSDLLNLNSFNMPYEIYSK
jgi:hypothetical protein